MSEKKLDSKIPEGPIQEKWDNHKFSTKLINPANKRKYKVLVVGTGLPGSSAAATLSELGYKVEAFLYSRLTKTSPLNCSARGINAAKNYTNDGDSIWRLFMTP